MTNQAEDGKFDDSPEGNPSPISIEDGNLYVSEKEWTRLCSEEDTSQLVSILRNMREVLSRDRSVRLIGANGGIEVSADRQTEFQRILDDANYRRASLSLAPVVPLD